LLPPGSLPPLVSLPRLFPQGHLPILGTSPGQIRITVLFAFFFFEPFLNFLHPSFPSSLSTPVSNCGDRSTPSSVFIPPLFFADPKGTLRPPPLRAHFSLFGKSPRPILISYLPSCWTIRFLRMSFSRPLPCGPPSLSALSMRISCDSFFSDP